MRILLKNSQGSQVREVQEILSDRGYPVEITGFYGQATANAVKAFQAQNLDQHGQPLVVDGKVGPLTWWSLHHPRPDIELPLPVVFSEMPPANAGGSPIGLAALRTAVGEYNDNAREIGGNNRGRYVVKYLNGLAPEGSSWCAGFVSWCFSLNQGNMPFDYTVGARDILKQFKNNGWAREPQSGYQPFPGDVVVWWRVSATGWPGHVGLVYQLLDGMLYTIEGNKSPRVQGFSYVFSRMEKLLGFGHVPA